MTPGPAPSSPSPATSATTTTGEGSYAWTTRPMAERFDVIAVAVAHRTGALEIGDCALAAAVSAAHRGDAFAACSALVEETKARIPVWKHQFFADGTDEWVNCA